MNDAAAPFALFPALAMVLLGLVLGAIAGSFLATVLDRWPRGQSVAGASRSHCEHCGRRLRWFELAPVISWLALRGRCRTCRAPIAVTNLAVELVCALLGGAAFALGAPMLAPFAWLLVILALFDARMLWLPNPLVAALAVAALAAPPHDPGLPFAWRVLAGAGAWAVLWLLAAGYRRWRGRDGLGGGDPKLFGAIALWSGPLLLPQILLVACALGLADAVRRVARGADAGSVALPFGTYLAVATILIAAIRAIVSIVGG